jgi:chromosome segregation ATPase
MSSSDSICSNTSASASENSNLTRLNTILQSRVADLTEKLKAALQGQKDQLTELESAQSTFRSDYLKLEEKYLASLKENEQLKIVINQHAGQVSTLREGQLVAAKKMAVMSVEMTELSDQLMILKCQNQELSQKYEEKERNLTLLSSQFDILGKEFVELKSNLTSEREELQQSLAHSITENGLLTDKLAENEIKMSLQTSTQQELNDLLLNMQARLRASEEALAAERSQQTDTSQSTARMIANLEQRIKDAGGQTQQLSLQVQTVSAENTRQTALLETYQNWEKQWHQEKSVLESELKKCQHQLVSATERLTASSASDNQLGLTTTELVDTRAQLTVALASAEETEILNKKLAKQLEDSERRQQQLVNESKFQLETSNARIMEISNRNASLQTEIISTKNSLLMAENALQGDKDTYLKVKLDYDSCHSKLRAATSRIQVR